jgi:hypothetical protein
MPLQISKTNALLGIQTNPGRMEMNSTQPKIEMQSQRPEVKIIREPIKVLIDQREAFASAGLKNVARILRENAQKGIQSVHEYLAKYSADGDLLSNIQNRTDAITDIVVRDSYTEKFVNIGVMPSERPKFEVQGSLQFHPKSFTEAIHNGVSFSVTPGNLNIQYTPAQIRIFVRQYSSIHFRYVPDPRIDIKL